MDQQGIDRLRSGGVITTYHCTAQCAHCLYNCSPRRRDMHMSEEMAGRICRLIKSLGCSSVHIGGGEPLLRPEALCAVIQVACREGLAIDYVETNSSWYKEREKACRILQKLKSIGVNTLLLSISPFHNASVPFDKVLAVMQCCRDVGMGVLPWTADFIKDMETFDRSRRHSLAEYCQVYGDNYLLSVLRRYWIHFGGRALATFRPLLPCFKAERIIAASEDSCRVQLSDTTHFHVDLFGNYIPGLCAGLVLTIDQLGQKIDIVRFPVLKCLWDKGIGGLFSWAREDFGYVPQGEFLNKCDLCNDIRRHIIRAGGHSPDLAPLGYYEI